MVASDAFSSAVNPGPSSTARTARTHCSTADSRHDAVLVSRFNRGDESAFVEIVARYHGKVFAIAFSLLRNRADAEEIAQDTFVRAHRGLARFRGDAALATWLHRVALNLSRNRYWYNRRRHQHTTRSFDSPCSDTNPTTLASLLASDAPSPAQEAVTTEFSELVALCMDRLGADHREILTQRNLRNCSYDEIARTLGISIGTVKSRIARARENLRLLLAEASPEFSPDSSPGAWFDHVRPANGLEIVCA